MSRANRGFTCVLFVRCKSDLLAKLDQLRFELSKANPGQSISRADVARTLLYQALEGKQSEEEE